MNLGLWPEAVPFDPDDGAGSQELDSYLAGTEFPPAALIVAGRGTGPSDWSARAAIGLARALVAGGAEVLLADLEFENPSLHNVLSESAIEGLSDVLLFGSSLERVTVLPAGQSFEFVASGGYAPDPVALMKAPGWSRILSELAARGTVFLGYAHHDVPGLDALIERVPDIVLLATPEEMSRTAASLPEGIRIVATIRPAGAGAGATEPIEDAELPAGAAADTTTAGQTIPPAVSPVAGGAAVDDAVGALPDAAESGIAAADEPAAESIAGASDSEPDRPAGADTGAGRVAPPEAEDSERIRLPKDEAREALIADLQARQRSAMARAAASAEASSPGEDAVVAADAPAERAPAEPADAARRDAESPEPTARPTRRGRYLGAALLVVVAVAVIGYFGFGRGGGAGDAPTLPPTTAQPTAPPEPAGDPLAWSVAVESNASLSAALRSVDALATSDSSIGFYISPAVVAGDLWYRILAGPLTDSLTAVAAMDRLVDRGLKRGSGVWDVRNTPLTFLLGRYRLRTDAVERMHELSDDGVPTYIVEVPYTRGEPWYHIYGGAYAEASEAERMGRILRDAGLPDSLVVRVGRAAS